MLRVAIQVKELISSNVTSAIETASDPVKMLNKLQREIEESIISLQGERTRTAQQKTRLEGQLTQHEDNEAEWGGKAKTAMDHGREDLARQALIAREDCRETIAQTKDSIAAAVAELAEIDDAMQALETKRLETRDQVREMVAATGTGAASNTNTNTAGKAEGHMNRISELEKRAEFMAEEDAQKRSHTAIDAEIEEMRRQSAVDAELEALKAGAKKAPAKKRAAKKT